MGWGTPGLGDDLGRVAKPPVVPKGVEVGPHGPLLELLERDTMTRTKFLASVVV